MDDTARSLILKSWSTRPDEIRFPPASKSALTAFERAFGAIPEDFRWFLAACGGGVVGSEWIDGIAQLEASHRKYLQERLAGGWKSNIFIIGWDGTGYPLGIDRNSGAVVVEAEGSNGDVRQLAPSIEAFLLAGLFD